MGCDIHAMIERKINGFWVNAGNPDLHRDYELFALLADVRNHDNKIIPISKPKGAPDNCCDEFSTWLASWDADAHSISYLSLNELKNADLNQSYYNDHLILSRDADGRITTTCTATNGQHLGPVGHVRIFQTWGTEHWESLISALEESKQLGQSDDDVRLCFFFDN